MENETPSAMPTPIESQVAAIRARRRKKFNWNWVVAPLMLIIGVLIGFFGRPLVLPEKSTGNSVVDQLIAQTRHFKGNANAPVTILEFSDFQ
jgi:hypothetical protein